MLKIAAACGNGMGSSLIVKMRIVDVFKELGIEASVEHMSVGDAKNRGKNFDLIYISKALEHNLKDIEGPKIIGLKNLLSKEEILEKTKEVFVLN